MAPEVGRSLLPRPIGEHLDNGEAGCTCQRVSTKGAAMLSRMDDPEYVTVTDDGRYRHDSGAERLPEQVQVRFDTFMLTGEGGSRAAETGLDLVGHEQHVLLGADLAYPTEVTLGSSDDSRFPLDGFEQDGDRVGVDRRVQRRCVAERDNVEPGREWPEAGTCGVVVREAHDADGAAMEVVACNDDSRLVCRYALDLVTPLARDLEPSLDGLRAGVHGQHHVLVGQVCQRLGEGPQYVVMERPARSEEHT